MSHSVQIIDHKQLSDGQLAILAECCGQPSTLSWLTCAAEVVVDEKQYQDAINFHCQRVGLLHESMNQALAKAKATIGKKIPVTVTLPASANQAEEIVESLVGTSSQVDLAATPTVQ